jgi:hypothetical protein
MFLVSSLTNYLSGNPRIYIKKIGILIFAILSTTPFLANAELQIKIRKGNSYESLGWASKIEPKWEKNEEGVFVFYRFISIQVPQDYSIKKAISKQKDKLIVSSNGTLLQIKSLSNSDKISFLTLQKKKHVLSIQFTGDFALDNDTNGCKDENLFLALKIGKNLPFPVSMKCYKKDKKSFFVVVVPKDVEWRETTISESNGKGESWKEYEVDDIPIGDNELRGSFTYGYRKAEYIVDLRSTKGKVEEEIIKSKTVFSAGLGLLNLTVDSDVSEASSSPISAYLKMESPLAVWKLEAGLSVIVPLLAGEPNEPSFFEAKGYVVKKFSLSPNFIFNAGLFGIFSESSDPSVYLQIKHQQIGVGGGLKYFFNSKTELQTDLWYSGFLATTATSQMGLSARFIYQYTKALGFGLEVGTQNLTTESDSGQESSMAETHFHALLRFVPF